MFGRNGAVSPRRSSSDSFLAQVGRVRTRCSSSLLTCTSAEAEAGIAEHRTEPVGHQPPGLRVRVQAVRRDVATRTLYLRPCSSAFRSQLALHQGQIVAHFARRRARAEDHGDHREGGASGAVEALLQWTPSTGFAVAWSSRRRVPVLSA
ncbi:hypothetical protein AMK12_20700 [Streptomyces sp. TSRI0395]|nr:hypothetical protein AMK12_20700 [Streptomyces sp. TSRI0395]